MVNKKAIRIIEYRCTITKSHRQIVNRRRDIDTLMDQIRTGNQCSIQVPRKISSHLPIGYSFNDFEK